MEMEKARSSICYGGFMIENTYLQEKVYPKLKKTWKWWKTNKIWVTELPKKRKLIRRRVFEMLDNGKKILKSDNEIRNGGVVVKI